MYFIRHKTGMVTSSEDLWTAHDGSYVRVNEDGVELFTTQLDEIWYESSYGKRIRTIFKSTGNDAMTYEQFLEKYAEVNNHDIVQRYTEKLEEVKKIASENLNKMKEQLQQVHDEKIAEAERIHDESVKCRDDYIKYKKDASAIIDEKVKTALEKYEPNFSYCMVCGYQNAFNKLRGITGYKKYFIEKWTGISIDKL